MMGREKPEQSRDLKTVVILAAFLLLLNLFLQRSMLVHAALALLLTGLFVKPAAGVIARTWLSIAGLLGAFNSRVVLSLLFYLFLTPLAVLYRLFCKNPLQLKNNPDAVSMYRVRNHRYTRSDFEKMW